MAGEETASVMTDEAADPEEAADINYDPDFMQVFEAEEAAFYGKYQDRERQAGLYGDGLPDRHAGRSRYGDLHGNGARNRNV